MENPRINEPGLEPDFDNRPGLAVAFEQQSAAADRLGSLLYADLCRRASADCAAESRLGRLLQPWSDARYGDMFPLRVLGAAHRLVLEHNAPKLGVNFPSVGGTVPTSERSQAACFESFVDALEDHADRLDDLFARAPQTNETGRAATLIGVLHHVSSAYSMPIRLHELGASAGLLLRADRMRVTWNGGSTGPVDSPLVLADGWHGQQADFPPYECVIDVVQRSGVDQNPVDLNTTDGRLHLTSFVWPDQVERHERLRAAILLAQDVPATVVKSNIESYVRALAPVPGTALVLWHSSVWFYLDEDERARTLLAIQELGQRAAPDAPVVHAALEYVATPVGHRFLAMARGWPTWPMDVKEGDLTVLGTAPAHGLPVTWQTSYRVPNPF